MKPDYWMDGDLVVQFRSGVRVLRISGCTSCCGLPGCPQSDDCRSFFVYVMRFYADGTREWRMANTGGMPRDWAIRTASRRALDNEHFADHLPEDRAAIERWNADGCP